MSVRSVSSEIAALTRRRWIQGGGALAGAMLWPGLLRARQSKRSQAKAERAIVIYLQGGLSHYESFDPKPDAPSAWRGEFRPAATSVPGTHFAEHMPLLSARAHKFNVIRSAYVDSPSHPVAIHMTLTGWDLPGASVEGKNRNRTYPSIGSIVARERRAARPELPAYVTVPHAGQLGVRVHYATAGLLGAAYEPLDSGMLPERANQPFQGPPDLTLQRELPPDRLEERLALLRTIERGFDRDEIVGLDTFQRQAQQILAGNVAGRAFNLDEEPRPVRERYGNHLWGQQTVLARRLAEAGVPFTLVNFTINQVKGQDWDTHVDNFNLMKDTLLPPMDLAVSTLLDDLEERGLLETTLVAMFGEFGRTPRINANAGRDHWEKVFSVMLAGGGLKSGVVVGASTRGGDLPLDRPIHFNDVLATIYHQLGVDTGRISHDALGRPIPVLDRGQPIAELL